MTTLLLGPTRDEVNTELARLAARANGRCRVRTATIELTPEQWEKPTGRRRAGGEVPGRAYLDYSRTCTTTVMGVVWAPCGDGRRAVIMTSSRVEARPGNGPYFPWCFYRQEWDAGRPYLLMCSVFNDYIEGMVPSLVPVTHDGSLLPAITPPQCLALLRLLEAGPPVETPDCFTTADLAELCLWLRVRVRLYDARHHPDNATPVSNRADRKRRIRPRPR